MSTFSLRNVAHSIAILRRSFVVLTCCHCIVYIHAQDGVTALISAAYAGRTDCVRLLLDVGADKNAQDKVSVHVWGLVNE